VAGKEWEFGGGIDGRKEGGRDCRVAMAWFAKLLNPSIRNEDEP